VSAAWGGGGVAPRDPATLVSFEVPDPPAFSEQAAAEGVVVRGIPGRELARASVGAWNSGEEIERLVELAVAAASR
jgi:L-cysteine/cystine lyase